MELCGNFTNIWIPQSSFLQTISKLIRVTIKSSLTRISSEFKMSWSYLWGIYKLVQVSHTCIDRLKSSKRRKSFKKVRNKTIKKDAVQWNSTERSGCLIPRAKRAREKIIFKKLLQPQQDLIQLWKNQLTSFFSFLWIDFQKWRGIPANSNWLLWTAMNCRYSSSSSAILVAQPHGLLGMSRRKIFCHVHTGAG